MVKALLLSGVGIALLWVLNIVISPRLRRRVGDDDPYFKKVVQNGDNLFYCLLGLGAVALAWYFWEAIKWVVLIVYALFLLWDIYSLVVGGVLTILVSRKFNVYNDSIVWLSNLLSGIGTVLVLYPTVKYLFEWI